MSPGTASLLGILFPAAIVLVLVFVCSPNLKERCQCLLGCLLLFVGLPLCMVALYCTVAAIPGLGLVLIALCLLRGVLADHRAAVAAAQPRRRLDRW